MDPIIEFIKIIPSLIKSNSNVLINLSMLFAFLVVNNFSAINNYLHKEDLTAQFIDKGFRVETVMERIRQDYDADAVCVAILHNGTTAAANPNFHLMKFTVMFSVGENSKHTKVFYRDQPLNLWIDSFRKMIISGHYIIKNMSESEDPIVRRIGDRTGNVTQIYVPIYSDEHYLLGFCIVSYKTKRTLSDKNVAQIKRSVMEIESIL